ncbi:MAG: hypothetical protein GY814_11625 [Gammaproteobacteria bacterium]|nr:hypothetical protein [Gammaproteobacteria bacterium]
MNVWELITGASSLPVQSGTTLWSHINSLSDYLHVYENLEVTLEMADYEIELVSDYSVELDDQEYEIELNDDYEVELD